MREKSVLTNEFVDNIKNIIPMATIIVKDMIGVTIKPFISIAKPSLTSSAVDKFVFSNTTLHLPNTTTH